MPTTLTNGIQLPDKGSVDWYNSMQSNYNLIDTHLGDTDVHVTAEDKANWNSKQGSLSQAQLDAIAQVATNTDDIATLQSGKANASHTHSSSDITDIGDYATKQYVDNSISGLVDSAPTALDTLNELSAALNDDANFASTVATALSAKANSADLATVATSGSYTDLSNKPTINDSTITIQKNGSTVDTFTTNGSAKTIDIPVPTKTSDLTNDSNFVDTSNSAVASGITSAKVTSYDSHVADTDIHVTTADKNKWNNQTYVFRYSSTALTASSTNSNTLLDNTDNLKVDDKVIDSDGVLFSITAIDTANSTFSIGTALIDLAQDSDVVHTSGNETIGGVKTFSDNPVIGSNNANITVSNRQITANGSYSTPTGNSYSYIQLKALVNYTDSSPSIDATVGLSVQENAYSDGKNRAFSPSSNNIIDLGLPGKRWANVYATNYYYGGSEIEFSQKFVTTDTDQTVSGAKTFLDVPITLKSSTAELGVTGGNTKVIFTDKNLLNLAGITFGNYGSSKLSYCRFHIYDKDSNNQEVENFIEFSYVNNNQTAYFRPNKSNFVTLGAVNNRWSKVYADEFYYGSNNVEFSTKFVTTDTAQTISGAKTFSDNLTIYNSDDTQTPKGLNIKNAQWSMGESGGTTGSTINFLDKNSSIPASITASKGIYGQSFLRFAVRTKDSQNNTYTEEIYYNVDTSGNVEFRPWHDNIISLGTSAYKWKDVQTKLINGLTPSSLSMPSGNVSDVIDISSYLVNLDGTDNTYIAPSNGWITINMNNCSGIHAIITGFWGDSRVRASAGAIKFLMPVLKNQTVTLTIHGGTINNARFIPCQGNV